MGTTKTFSITHMRIYFSVWSIILTFFWTRPGNVSAICCGEGSREVSESGSQWTLVMNYANFGAGKYGDITTTHCQCRQACLDLDGCTGYDWFPAGNVTKCWVGNNCPATLTYDANNQHYTPKSKESCYASATTLSWNLVMNYANFGAGKYGDITTTHCQCRQACIDLDGCTGYDWFPEGNVTKCWVGNNCPVSLTYDVNNQHYTPNLKLDCYDAQFRGKKADKRLCNRLRCKKY